MTFASRQPSFTSPTTFPAGIRTSEKKTSLNSWVPVICTSGRTSIPGVCMSTTKYVMPLWASAVGSVRARRMPYRATCASVVHTFWPLTTNSSPSRSARVVSDARSLPAPGSLNS